MCEFGGALFVLSYEYASPSPPPPHTQKHKHTHNGNTNTTPTHAHLRLQREARDAALAVHLVAQQRDADKVRDLGQDEQGVVVLDRAPQHEQRLLVWVVLFFGGSVWL